MLIGIKFRKQHYISIVFLSYQTVTYYVFIFSNFEVYVNAVHIVNQFSMEVALTFIYSRYIIMVFVATTLLVNYIILPVISRAHTQDMLV